jgi:hypothetical protein
MGTVRTARKILARAAVLAMTLAGPVVAAGAAGAGTVPVVYAAHNDGGWAAYVKPRGFFFGNGGAPFFAQLRWSSWNGTSAWSEGKLSTQERGCAPSYKCSRTTQWVGVYLSTVRTHGGTRYYDRMAVEFWRGGKRHWVTGWFRNGYWVFPQAWPYL